jgi:hypothetical protein
MRAASGRSNGIVKLSGFWLGGAELVGGEHTMIEFKGSYFERDVILWAVRWYVAYLISYRQLEE